MRYSLPVFLIFLVASIAHATPSQTAFTLTHGVVRVVRPGFEAGEISVGDSAVVTARAEGSESVSLNPGQAGMTEVTVTSKDRSTTVQYLISVRNDDTGRVIAELENFFRGQAVIVQAIASTIVLRGEVDIPQDLMQIETMVASLREASPPVSVSNLVRLRPETYSRLAERIEREIGSPEITARFVGNQLFLEGTAESEFEGDRAVELAKAYLADPRLSGNRGTAGLAGTGPQASKSQGGNGFTIVDMLRVRPKMTAPPRKTGR